MRSLVGIIMGYLDDYRAGRTRKAAPLTFIFRGAWLQLRNHTSIARFHYVKIAQGLVTTCVCFSYVFLVLVFLFLHRFTLVTSRKLSLFGENQANRPYHQPL